MLVFFVSSPNRVLRFGGIDFSLAHRHSPARAAIPGFLREKNGRLLSTKDEGGRGYGMQSIAQIAEKTGGSMEYESHDGIFTVNVLLNLLLSEEEPLRP